MEVDFNKCCCVQFNSKKKQSVCVCVYIYKYVFAVHFNQFIINFHLSITIWTPKHVNRETLKLTLFFLYLTTQQSMHMKNCLYVYTHRNKISKLLLHTYAVIRQYLNVFHFNLFHLTMWQVYVYEHRKMYQQTYARIGCRLLKN